ncbi:MAG: BrnA antitoxin family protein [bacterium]|nr:BrnA antitoxin family protein [bacterium]
MPQTKKGVCLRLDPDILDWLKEQGPGYQTKINARIGSILTFDLVLTRRFRYRCGASQGLMV